MGEELKPKRKKIGRGLYLLPEVWDQIDEIVTAKNRKLDRKLYSSFTRNDLLEDYVREGMAKDLKELSNKR